ncbi:hypothetical protein CERZMDRAFT_96079 [Cercospora zeae-maydis SCOH1-5]|uniref:Uncharacterized protein n=1 Tax=Cercospora zeae-maydis SCOH1-5 TaxID=717836 RepID=A0A6A6FL01_9PEZI|nr:hypothetical protein CERZMDRAFT_96079 [Cercospora zeae-maydis SCOH1-5]
MVVLAGTFTGANGAVSVIFIQVGPERLRLPSFDNVGPGSCLCDTLAQAQRRRAWQSCQRQLIESSLRSRSHLRVAGDCGEEETNAAEGKMIKAYGQHRSTVLSNTPAYGEAHEPLPTHPRSLERVTAADVHVLHMGVKSSSG